MNPLPELREKGEGARLAKNYYNTLGLWITRVGKRLFTAFA
jgi:hypothetical protein